MPAELQIILVPLLAVLTVAGIAYGLFAPQLNGESEQKKRREKIVSPGDARMQQLLAKGKGDRRKHISETLASLDQQNKKRKKVSLKKQIKRAGLKMSVSKYIIMCILLGAGAAFLALLAMQNVLIGAFAFISASIGLGKFLLKFLARRRMNRFLLELPNAIDIVVRGIKTGLPLADCFRVIAKEAKDPLRTEFQEVVDAQVLGQTFGEALERMFERVPLPEVNFLAIVITIQQSSGGNLAEALSNLSKVIRERKKMSDKVNSVSQEAKSSAAIIGALPLVVAGGLYFISPDYVGLLFETSIGHFMLAGCGVWMMIGVLVMAKMINFEI